MFGHETFHLPSGSEPMAVVSVDRRVDAPVEAVRSLIEDVQPFMEAGRFDEVRLDGDTLHLTNIIGFARIELTLELIDDPGAALAYRQQDGIFEEMETRYSVEAADDGTLVRAVTEFTLGGVTGSVLDNTIIRRQRRKEISNQFDYLERAAGQG